MKNGTITILCADDDPEDRMLLKDALEEARVTDAPHFVENGQELMDYLYYRGKHNPGNAPRPDVILLDLNMPKKGGREVLREIKADPNLRHIPIVALTTSSAEEDISCTYDLGVNSYITKPAKFEGLVEAMRALGCYWFQTVELPAKKNGASS